MRPPESGWLLRIVAIVVCGICSQLTMSACTNDTEDVPVFVPSVSYDTVAVLGKSDETNPLFVFGDWFGGLLNDSIVVFSDPISPGRMVVANWVTGDGWQIETPRGMKGPGEFGGQQPYPFPVDDRIHTIIPDGTYQTFSREGDLLASLQYQVPPFIFSDPESSVVPLGVAGDRVVAAFEVYPDPSGPSVQELRQGLRVFDERGIVAEIVDGIPRVVRRLPNRGDTLTLILPYESLAAAARGKTIAWVIGRRRWITTLSAAGELVASREMEFPLWNVRIDADQRVWAYTLSRDSSGTLGIVVMDRELNELFRVAEKHVIDAAGSTILARKRGELGLSLMVLLRRRE